MTSSLLTAVRWIGVIPVAVVGGVLAGMIANVLNQVSFSWSGLNPESFISRIYTDGMANLVLGGVGIYLGARTAPAHKAKVALALSGLVLVVGGFVMFPTIAERNWWGVYGTAMLIAAAAVTAWSIHSGDLPDSHFE